MDSRPPDDEVTFAFSVGKSESGLARSVMTSEDRDIMREWSVSEVNEITHLMQYEMVNIIRIPF